MPIIFVAAFPEEAIRARVLGEGALGYLAKPLQAECLARRFPYQKHEEDRDLPEFRRRIVELKRDSKLAVCQKLRMHHARAFLQIRIQVRQNQRLRH